MATTTTFQLIRKQMYVKLRAITPTYAAATLFDASPVQYRRPFREWAAEAGTAAFRKCEIRATGPEVDAQWCDPTAKEVTVTAILTIAYPTAPGIAGTADKDFFLDDLIASDAKQVPDKVFSAANYLDGQMTTFATIGELDRSNPMMYFQDIELSVCFHKTQSLD